MQTRRFFLPGSVNDIGVWLLGSLWSPFLWIGTDNVFIHAEGRPPHLVHAAHISKGIFALISASIFSISVVILSIPGAFLVGELSIALYISSRISFGRSNKAGFGLYPSLSWHMFDKCAVNSSLSNGRPLILFLLVLLFLNRCILASCSIAFALSLLFSSFSYFWVSPRFLLSLASL